jgi:hypothetical protein
MTSLEEKFISFCKNSSSSLGPGINDSYSIKDIKYFEKQIEKYSISTKNQEKKEFIEEEIEKAKKVEKGIFDMIEVFDKSKLPDKIDNIFPDGYDSKTISNIKLKDLTTSATQFKELCFKLFRDVYLKKANQGELESIFGSMANYSRILPQSFGLIPIDGLWKIFEEFYLKYNNSQPFDKESFFKNFIDKLKINEGPILENTTKKSIEKINNKIEFNVFKKNLWYDFDKTKDNTKYDSYGVFYTDGTKAYVYLKYSTDIHHYLSHYNIGINIFLAKVFNSSYSPTSITTDQNNHINDFLKNNKNFNERISYPFNQKDFIESLKKYFVENRENPEIIIDKIKKEPSNYDLIEIGTPKYKLIRALFHFSNIYTTYMKLLEHFFKNINECYDIYLLLVVKIKRKSESESKNNKNGYINKDIDDIQKKLNILKKIIEKIPIYFNSQLVDYGKETEFTKRLIGYTRLEYSWVSNYRINIDDDFMKILMIFFKVNEENLPVGGIPIKILKEESDFNKLIFTCFNFFLKYRFKSNKQYIELLQNYKKKSDEKLSKDKYSFVKTEVEKEISKIEENTDLSSIDKEIIFINCKKILKYSIIFVFNLYIKTIKEFKYENNTPKNKKVIINKIGEFKEFINQYIYYLGKKINNPSYNTFREFIIGYLTQYIYLLDNYNEKKSEEAYKKLKILLRDKNKNSKFEKIADNIVKILTDKDRSLTPKKRFGIVGREYITLSNNAKREINRYINPEIYTSLYWANYEKKFMEENENKKLFVIAVEPKYAVIEKLAKVNVFLIDLFATLKSDSPPKISREIKTIRIFNEKDNTITKEIYSNENNMIELNHIFRTVRDIAGKIQKSWSKNIKGKWKKFLFGRFFSAEGLHSPGYFNFTPGHVFAKTFGIYKRKIGNGNGDENLGYTATEKLQLLTNGKLSSYTQDNKNKDDYINMALLMGYNKEQLLEILQTYDNYINNRRSNRLYDFDPKQNNDWQVYVIRKENYESANSMREWANRLLNSKPLIYLKEYSDPKIIPLSDFNKIQAPFSRYFIKSWIRMKYPVSKELPTYLLDIFNGFFEKAVKNEQNVKDLKNNSLFVSADTFFDYDLKYNYEDDSLIKLENRNTTNIAFNLNKSTTSFNANRNFDINSIIVPKELKNNQIGNTLKSNNYRLANILTKKSKPLNISSVSTLSETRKLFENILKKHNISKSQIKIYENQSTNFDLEFNLDKFELTYIRSSQKTTREIKFEPIDSSFKVKFEKNPTDDLMIEFKLDSINFFTKDSNNFILKRILTVLEKEKEYIIFNDYKENNLGLIFRSEFKYLTNSFFGFYFYTYSDDKIKYKYRLQLKDKRNRDIFDVIVERFVDDIKYYSPHNQLYTKKGNYSILEITSDVLIAIKSIPNLEIYKHYYNTIEKIEFLNEKGLTPFTKIFNNFFDWKKTSDSKTRNQYIKSLNTVENNNNKVFLTNAINNFKLKYSIDSEITNDKFKITLTDGTIYMIDIKNLTLNYNKNNIKDVKNLTYFHDSTNEFFYAIISEQNDIDPAIMFFIYKNNMTIKHIFNSKRMNYKGELLLNFEKSSKLNILILNNNFSTNDVFFNNNTYFQYIINHFFEKNGELSYKNFCEIYYGKDISSNDLSVLFRPLDKDRKPIMEINLACTYNGDNEAYLENLYTDENKDENDFIEILDNSANNLLHSAEIIKPTNQDNYLILFDYTNFNIYKISINSLNNYSYYILNYNINTGYSFNNFTPDQSFIDRYRDIQFS